MAYLIFHKREDAEQFESALMEAKHGIKKACEIFEDMKEQFGERRGGYDERGGYNERYDGRYQVNGGYDERSYYPKQYPAWDERRDSKGRYM